jgi:hypothetical protein
MNVDSETTRFQAGTVDSQADSEARRNLLFRRMKSNVYYIYIKIFCYYCKALPHRISRGHRKTARRLIENVYRIIKTSCWTILVKFDQILLILFFCLLVKMACCLSIKDSYYYFICCHFQLLKKAHRLVKR